MVLRIWSSKKVVEPEQHLPVPKRLPPMKMVYATRFLGISGNKRTR